MNKYLQEAGEHKFKSWSLEASKRRN